MQHELEIGVPPDRIADHAYLLQKGAAQLNIAAERIKGLKIRKRSIDARAKRVVFRARIVFYVDEVPVPDILRVDYANVADAPSVIIVGAGPAGLFAALRCLERGFRPIVVERGKDVRERRRDLAILNRDGAVTPIRIIALAKAGPAPIPTANYTPGLTSEAMCNRCFSCLWRMALRTIS